MKIFSTKKIATDIAGTAHFVIETHSITLISKSSPGTTIITISFIGGSPETETDEISFTLTDMFFMRTTERIKSIKISWTVDLGNEIQVIFGDIENIK